jgi:L-amino acid N-acyltransferase YncA
MVFDLAERRGLIKASRATYSAARRWPFEQRRDKPEFAEGLAALDKFRKELAAEKVVKVPVSKRTTRRKVISEQDLQDLLDELTGLHAKGSTWAGIARRWFASSVDVGLRPGEREFA